jgi:hypothetical protein
MVKLTKRDDAILTWCLDAKWLSTHQLYRLFFSHATLAAARHRLRTLVTSGYLHEYRRNPFSDFLYAVGPKGKQILEPKGWSVTVSRTPPDHLDHLMGINDLRVAFARDLSRLDFFYAHWELGRFAWPYPVVPDALVCVRLDRQAYFTFEYDRGYENPRTLAKKVGLYHTLPPSFPLDAVSVVTDSAPSVERVLRALRSCGHHPFAVLVGCLEAIRTDGITGTIFTDTKSSAVLSLNEVIALRDLEEP